MLASAVKLFNSTDTSAEEQTQGLESLLGLQPAFHQLVLFDAQNRQFALASRISKIVAVRFTRRVSSDMQSQGDWGKYMPAGSISMVTPASHWSISPYRPIDALGNFHGTLVAELSLKFMWNVVDQLKAGTTGVAYVVDGQGTLIAYRNTARVLRGEKANNLREVQDFLDKSFSPGTRTGGLNLGIEGSIVVGSLGPLETPGRAIVTELPWQEAYCGVIKIVLVSVGIMVAMAVVAGLLGNSLARRLAVPLVDLTETATRIAGGEMELQMELKGPQEVISLGKAFNSMTAQLRDLIDTLEKRVAARAQKLEQAYETLQKQQEIILISERMASLCRLTAGIAHEMNSPLGPSTHEPQAIDVVLAVEDVLLRA